MLGPRNSYRTLDVRRDAVVSATRLCTLCGEQRSYTATLVYQCMPCSLGPAPSPHVHCRLGVRFYLLTFLHVGTSAPVLVFTTVPRVSRSGSHTRRVERDRVEAHAEHLGDMGTHCKLHARG